MTNLVAAITISIVTNWTTVSTINPVRGNSGSIVYAVYQATGYNELGAILSNTIATVEWQGRQVPVILSSKNIGTLNRTVWK